MKRLVLASGSPRRRELLNTLGISFSVVAAGIDETIPGGVSPARGACLVAEQKAREVAALLGPDVTILAADTIVVVDGVILGKPKDRHTAKEMLQTLSGRSHEVITGVALLHEGGCRTLAASTEVVFRALDRTMIEWYLSTGEPYDKAGGYGIQGFASALVESITGSYTNVVGLPLAQTVALLQEAGFAPWQIGCES
jgi:septum formation protein